MKKILSIMASLALSGCAASSVNVKSLVLPTSNKSIDVVQHRSSVEFLDCGTLIVLQTYSAVGDLIDSKEARGEALHCGAITAGIQSGGMVGAAHALRPSKNSTNVENSNVQTQGQGQEQVQSQAQEATANAAAAAQATASSAAKSNSKASGSTPKGTPSHEGKGPKGNNGKGNGGHDGSPNGKNDSDR